jgi:hypothetical protein
MALQAVGQRLRMLVDTVQPDRAGVRRQRAAHQFQQRGLAGAVLAAQPGDAGAQMQIELAEQRMAGKLEIQLIDTQHGGRLRC